jgi:hypothetical protein
MPSGRGTERRRLTGQVLVRLPADLAARLSAAAAAVEVSDAAHVRALLARELAADAAEAVPVRRARPPRAPRPDWLAQLDAAREVAAEINGTLRQIAGLSRAAGAPTGRYDDAADAARRAALELARRIGRVCRDLDGGGPPAGGQP